MEESSFSMADSDTFLNYQEAASYLKMSVPSLRNCVSLKQISAFRAGGTRRVRFLKSELRQWLTAQRTGAPVDETQPAA